MLILDSFFHYRHVGRFICVQKLNNLALSTHQVPALRKLVLFISIKNSLDLDDSCNSNYIYLLKLFFGRRFFVSNYSTIFHLNNLYHSFNIQSIYRGRKMYFPISFLSMAILPVLNKEFLLLKIFENFINIAVLDMNLFTEKKNNVGLFNLKDSLNYKFFFSGVDFNQNGEFFLSSLKLL
jgi:hypothetical protein